MLVLIKFAKVFFFYEIKMLFHPFFRERPLPAIHIKRRNLSKSPPLLIKLDTSPSHKHKSFRKTFTKATSKIFSRKSVASKALSSPNTAVDATNQNAVSGAGARNESAGICLLHVTDNDKPKVAHCNEYYNIITFMNEIMYVIAAFNVTCIAAIFGYLSFDLLF